MSGQRLDVREEEVRHLLQARDEAEQVAGVVVTPVVLRQHAPQLEAPCRRARGPKAGETRAVVGAEDGVTEQVRHADGHDLVEYVGRHLGVEREVARGRGTPIGRREAPLARAEPRVEGRARHGQTCR